MLEKSGMVLLDINDIQDYGKGLVSQRLQDVWGLTFNQLKSIISSNQYRLIGKNEDLKDGTSS